MRFIFLTGLVLATPSVASAQSKFGLTGKPDALIKDGFSNIAGVRELPGNRAIVTDQMERAIYLVDFDNGSRRQLGRQGDGPAEYRFPMAPLPGPGNATWILDASLRRLHVVTPDGSFQKSLTPPYAAVPGGLLTARGVDSRGRIYFEGNSFNSETGRFIDSIGVVRWDPRSDETMIVGRVWSGGRVVIQREGSPASVARVILPFPHVDAWTPLPDGRLAIVRQSPHTIAVVEAGREPTGGPPLPFSSIPVTAAERNSYRERNSAARMVASGGDVTRRSQIEDEMFPTNMPAFVAASVISDWLGRIWIGRSHRSTDRTWRYDVYGADGARIGIATLPVNSRIIGFGSSAAYVARTDPSTDLVYLERHRLPSRFP
jgi:hypothetical protein